MVGQFVWGAMNLARTIKYAVQARLFSIAPFIGLLSLAGLGSTEPGMNCCVIGVITIALAFVSVAPKLVGAILGLGGACFIGRIVITGQSTILSRAKVGHECREGCPGLRLFLAEVAC